MFSLFSNVRNQGSGKSPKIVWPYEIIEFVRFYVPSIFEMGPNFASLAPIFVEYGLYTNGLF